MVLIQFYYIKNKRCATLTIWGLNVQHGAVKTDFKNPPEMRGLKADEWKW